jgi:hypothetical protein
MFKINLRNKHGVLVALLAAGLITSCTAPPLAAPAPIATPQSATAQTAALQRPVFIEFYSTL